MLEATKLCKSFGGTRALSDVSLEIAKGSIIGLVGPNGSGKTTLLNVISGALKPDAGSVRFEGRDITGAEANVIAKSGLARSFQISRLFKSMSVLDNVLAASHEGITASARARATELIRLVGIERVIHNKAGSNVWWNLPEF